MEAKNEGKDNHIALNRKANNKMEIRDAYTDAFDEEMGQKGVARILTAKLRIQIFRRSLSWLGTIEILQEWFGCR